MERIIKYVNFGQETVRYPDREPEFSCIAPPVQEQAWEEQKGARGTKAVERNPSICGRDSCCKDTKLTTLIRQQD